MKKIFVLLGIITLTFGIFFAGCTEQMSADDIAKKMQEKYNSINDMSCNMVTTTNVQGKTQSITFNCKFKKPDKVYMESNDTIMVSNGKTLYIYDKTKNAYMKMDASPEIKGDYGAIIKSMINLYNITYERDGKVSGRDCYILKLTPKNKTGSMDVNTGALKIWVDKEYWQPLKVEVNGNGFSSITEYKNVKYNTGISDKTFEFTPPKDAKLIKNNMPKKMSIEDAQKEVPFKILIPKYTLDYKFSFAYIFNRSNYKSVQLIYTKKDNEKQAIVIIESNSNYSNNIPNAEKVKIGNIDGEYLKSIGGNILSFKKDNINIDIAGALEKKELIKIAESMN